MIDARDRRPPRAIGRSARLELAFIVRGGRTVLADAYAEPPLRVGRPFEDRGGLHMILASSAPGVFGGDQIEHRIYVGRGARVSLTSQSALQVHPGLTDAPALLRSRFEVDDDAELRCHWDPMIPFAGARIEQRIEIAVAARGGLFWSDALMSGRCARAERWAFEVVAHDLSLARDGALEYVERYRIEPARQRIARPWAAGAASYLGTTIASGTRIDRAAVEALHRRLNELPDVRAAADLLLPELLVVRLLSRSGPPFHAARDLIARSTAGFLVRCGLR